MGSLPKRSVPLSTTRQSRLLVVVAQFGYRGAVLRIELGIPPFSSKRLTAIRCGKCRSPRPQVSCLN